MERRGTSAGKRSSSSYGTLPAAPTRSAREDIANKPTFTLLPTVDTYPDFPVFAEPDVDSDREDDDDLSSAASTHGDSSEQDLSSSEADSADQADHAASAASTFGRAIACAHLAEVSMHAAILLPSDACDAEKAFASSVVRRVLKDLQAATWTTLQACASKPSLGSEDFNQVVDILRAMRLAYDEERAAARVRRQLGALQSRFRSRQPDETSALGHEDDMEDSASQAALLDAAEHVASDMAGLAALLLRALAKAAAFRPASPSEDEVGREADKGDILLDKVICCIQLAKEMVSSIPTHDSANTAELCNENLRSMSEQFTELANLLLPGRDVEALQQGVRFEERAVDSMRLISMAVAEKIASCTIQRTLMGLQLRCPDLKGKDDWDNRHVDIGALDRTERMTEQIMVELARLDALILRQSGGLSLSLDECEA